MLCPIWLLMGNWLIQIEFHLNFTSHLAVFLAVELMIILCMYFVNKQTLKDTTSPQHILIQMKLNSVILD